MSQMPEISGVHYNTHMSMEADLAEVMTKLETLRALRDAIRQERQTLHRVMANIVASRVDVTSLS
jgi:DNA-directed RNA polymerase specialized sigma54-like protein